MSQSPSLHLSASAGRYRSAIWFSARCEVDEAPGAADVESVDAAADGVRVQVGRGGTPNV